MSANRLAQGVFALAWISVSFAQPQLSTVQDTVYRADGTRFDGVALIEWRSLLAADLASVAAYNRSVRIVDGVLRVSLVPTTTASAGAYYYVRYTSNGRIQSTEFWAVPPSASLLKLSDIRLVGPPVGGGTPQSAPPGSVTSQISDVVGLTDELSARPRKGIGFVPSRMAMINASGDLESVVGQPTDCVRANGTTGPCDTSVSPTFVDAETPAGLINGTNVVYTLSNAPNPASSLRLHRNGILLKSGVDYTLSGTTITFIAPATPQPGDILLASFRINGAAQQSGEAGGALTGFFPSPSLAPGAIADLHVASNAAISESKLALNFPTHSPANDPTADQKAALAGTSGSPSNANRFVTDQDPRMTNARTPSGHALLGGSHFDANPGVVARGDLIVGQGTGPTLWNRLPLGAPNRCLTSNGFDAVWNACLFTGFPSGSVPFVDGTGNLAHSSNRLYWDNASRRLAIGSNTPTATLTVYDAGAGDGVTSVAIRAGAAQAGTPLQTWQSAGGTEVARVEADGLMVAGKIRASTTSTGAAWQESGGSTDPAGPANGDAWLNTTDHARKTRESSQTHALPQVICSTTGTASSSMTAQSLAQCRIPQAMLRSGDRFEIRYDLTHEGSAAPFSYTVYWGTTALTARGGAADESAAAGVISTAVQGSSVYWNWQNWGASATISAGTGSAAVSGGDIIVDVQGQMSASTSETVSLRSLTVVRLPAQANP